MRRHTKVPQDDDRWGGRIRLPEVGLTSGALSMTWGDR